MNARSHDAPAGHSTARVSSPAGNHTIYLASGLAAAGSPHGGQS